MRKGPWAARVQDVLREVFCELWVCSQQRLHPLEPIVSLVE
jgi:hypothetical protein